MTMWRKASKSTSDGGDCVELAEFPLAVGIRDSKDPHGPKIALPTTSFRDLMTAIKRGEHDTP
ncbi:DUF397 domain-containing protein [Actinomadura terrae]|uniref:DUF397 domain-containing protein n=1 Tax=Actinomadura terrae TaxID=604353 RepID=UPI001FA7F365|nr:DUF397 domain-containing protein [Actinomadura terrae]